MQRRAHRRRSGGGLRLEERGISAGGAPAGTEGRRSRSTVRNHGAAPANEVVVNDEPPPPLTYVHGTTTLNGKAASRRRAGTARSPRDSRVPASTSERSLPGQTVELTYLARAEPRRRDVARSELAGHDLQPRERGAHPGERPAGSSRSSELRARIARIPGVAAADGLSFVDLPPGLAAGRWRDRQARRAGLRASIGAIKSTTRRSGSPPGRSGPGRPC